MHCPYCGSSEFKRSRRRGLRDRVASWMERWPYRCASCRKRFWANVRWAEPVRWTARATRPARDVTAKIEIRAESQAELNHILLSLDNALHQFQPRRASKSKASGARPADATPVSRETHFIER